MDKNKKKHNGNSAPANTPSTPAGTNEQPAGDRSDAPTAENRKSENAKRTAPSLRRRRSFFCLFSAVCGNLFVIERSLRRAFRRVGRLRIGEQQPRICRRRA